MAINPNSPEYLLALEVTNLRLAVEVASSALYLGKTDRAREALARVSAPMRNHPAAARNVPGSPDTIRRASMGDAFLDWRRVRPSLLIAVNQERALRAQHAA